MNRTVFAIAAVVLGMTAALAQQDPIAARKALMKANGDAAKTAGAMIKGDMPFDPAAAHKIFVAFEDAATKMPALFPASSKPGDTSADSDPFSASPKIWDDDNMADLKARFAKFGDDAKAADASVKDLDSFKAAVGDIGKNDCGACHQLYRLKKS
jgi:cytochrome c556